MACNFTTMLFSINTRAISQKSTVFQCSQPLLHPLWCAVNFAMSTLQHFHRFRDLPHELQLHIWELYECALPRRRHYFRNMMVWSGRLYACADHHTNRRISNTANVDDPDQTQVPHAAVAPWTKIHLPSSSGAWDQHFVSDWEYHSAYTFGSILWPAPRMTSPLHIWVNFKYDTFCFARGRAHDSNGGDGNLFQYLQGATGMFALDSPQYPIMSHWFFRIQRLVLIKSAVTQPLGPLDRQILEVHPSLRRLTILALFDTFRCNHLRNGPQRQPGISGGYERIPLTSFLALRQEMTGSCACDQPMRRLGELEQLRRELVDLFDIRASTAPPVDVGIEVEVYWHRAPVAEPLAYPESP